MFPANPMRFLPVSIHDKVYAVAGIPAQDDSLAQEDPFDRELIVSILGECSMALEKDRIQREKEEEVLRRRNEKLRADLLRSISHDLRTPLTSIHPATSLTSRCASSSIPISTMTPSG